MNNILPENKKLDNFKIKAIQTTASLESDIKVSYKDTLVGNRIYRKAQRYNIEFKKNSIQHYLSIDVEPVKKDLVGYIALRIQKQILDFDLLSYNEVGLEHKKFIINAFKIKYEEELKKYYIDLSEEENAIQMGLYINNSALPKGEKTFEEIYEYIMQNMFQHIKKERNNRIESELKAAMQLSKH